MAPHKKAVRKAKAVKKPLKKKKKKSPKKKSRSAERKERVKKANMIAKRHKQKLLDAKISRQRQRNRQVMRMRRKMEKASRARRLERQDKKQQGKKGKDASTDEEDAFLFEQHIREDSCWRRFCLMLEDALAGLLFFLTVTLRSERTFDWLVFLANNLGLFQEYEINDYGQRLSPRTGRPVLLSLGPFRVVQVVESANQIRSHWDPYIRDYLRNSKLTTDCWRANRMALQVALCMDDTGQMFDMPIYQSVMQKVNKKFA